MNDFSLRCEVDIELPDANRFAEIGWDWLARGSAELARSFRRTMDEGAPLAADSVRRSGPIGPPGSVWGFLTVTRPAARGVRQSSRVYAGKNMSWLRKELTDPPVEAVLGISVLDGEGYPGEAPLRIGMRREERAPTWLRLWCEAPERRLLEPDGSKRWLGFLRSAVESVNPSFGQVDYRYTLGRTAVESTVGPPWRLPFQSIPDSRRILRGYSWLTICAQEVADRLGGVEGLRGTGAFVAVEPLAAGGVWLLATDDYRDYDAAAMARVFRALAPALPAGAPRRIDPAAGEPPYRVVWRDAAEESAGR